MREHEEGCLSIPDERVPIERPSTVTVRFLDREGKPQELARRGCWRPPSSTRSTISTAS